MAAKIKRMTSAWQMGEQRSLFTVAQNTFCPTALFFFLALATQEMWFYNFSSDTSVNGCDVWERGSRVRGVWRGGGPAAQTDLVPLVDAVDELRVRSCPRKTDRRGVHRLGLHIAGGDGGNLDAQRRGGRKHKTDREGRRGKSVDKKQQRVWEQLWVDCWKSACIYFDVCIDRSCSGQGRYRHHSLPHDTHTSYRAPCGFVCDCGSCLWILVGCPTCVGSTQRRVNANAAWQ